MTQILKLFKLQFDEKFDILKTGNIKKMLGAIIKYLLIIGGLTFAFYAIFLKFVLIGFVTNANLLSLVLVVTQVVSLLFAIGHIIKILFQNNDNEFLMSMPVSPNHVFISKIILSYVQEVIVNAIISLPLFISIGMLGGASGGYGLYYFMFLPLAILILPIMPLSMAILLSIPVNFILKFFKKHVILSTIFIMSLVVVLIVVYTRLLSGFAEGFNIASKQIETIGKINKWILNFGSKNVLYLYLAKGFMSISKIYFPIIFLVVGFALFILAFFVVKPFFFKVAMGNFESGAIVYREGKFKARSKLHSLIRVEFFKVFRSPGNIFDYFLFVILMPFVVFVYDNLLLDMVVSQAGVQMINGAHLLIVAVFATLSNIYASCAISREGSNFYIIKTMPVDYYTQTAAKVLFNAMFSVGSIIITGIVTCLYMDIMVAIFTTIICIFISLGHMFYSFDLDLKNPKLDWYDSGDIAKFNKNTTTSIVIGLILALLSGGIIMLLSTTNLGILTFILLLFLSLAFCVYRLYILILRVFYKYERLEP